MKDEFASSLRMRASDVEPQLTAQQVSDYLLSHPDFFLRHDEVLCGLQLPHRSGSAVSLVERQVSLLRERNIDSRQRLNRLLDTARENDELFSKTRHLILALLEAETLDRLAHSMATSIRREFDIDHCRLLLIEDGQFDWPAGAERIARADADATLGGIMRLGKPVAGPLRPAQREALFGAAAEQVQSGLVVSIGQAAPMAILAVGSHDPQRFHSEMGTLFMEFIGDALARLLPRFQQKA
jgi:uncharacterized protein